MSIICLRNSFLLLAEVHAWTQFSLSAFHDMLLGSVANSLFHLINFIVERIATSVMHLIIWSFDVYASGPSCSGNGWHA